MGSKLMRRISAMYSKRTGSVLSRWLGAFPQVLEETSDLPVPTGWALRRAQPPRWSTDTETNETRTTKTTLFLRVPGVSLLLSLRVLLGTSLPL